MKKKRISILLSLLFVASLMSFSGDAQSSKVNKEEAKAAYEYLTKFRANAKYEGKKIGLKLENIDRPVLKWNAILAKVAERKAMDMATRKYFSHVDPDGNGINYLIATAGYELPAEWYKKKGTNYFESIQAGASSGVDAIKDLIIDKGIPGFGHRKHLLGLDKFYANMTDIGIGYVDSPESRYGSYVCVIIAKHNF